MGMVVRHLIHTERNAQLVAWFHSRQWQLSCPININSVKYITESIKVGYYQSFNSSYFTLTVHLQ